VAFSFCNASTCLRKTLITSLEAEDSSLDACNSSLSEASADDSLAGKPNRLGEKPALAGDSAVLPLVPAGDRLLSAVLTDRRNLDRARKEVAGDGAAGASLAGGGDLWSTETACCTTELAAALAVCGGEGARMEELLGRRKLGLLALLAKDWKKEGFL